MLGPAGPHLTPGPAFASTAPAPSSGVRVSAGQLARQRNPAPCSLSKSPPRANVNCSVSSRSDLMPGQFVDVVTVASPTTLAPSLKDVDEAPVPVREGRSQSLSTLPRRASTANVLTVDSVASDTFTEEEELEFQRQQRVRHARRALSSGTGSSLSLLQQELGYPRRARVALDGQRHRRGSLLETALENTMAKRAHSTSHGSVHSNSSSSGSVCSASDLQRTQSVPEPEEENQIHQIHYHGRSWTFNLATCSPRSDAAGAASEDGRVQEEEEEENFMNYRSASVTGYSRDTDGVVYYEVIVRSIAHGPLSAYKVRRRYSEFRDLHAALSKVMPVSHRKLASVTAMASISDDSSNNNEDEDTSVGLRFSITDCGEDTEPTLPPLPDKGGVWSYLQFDTRVRHSRWSTNHRPAARRDVTTDTHSPQHLGTVLDFFLIEQVDAASVVRFVVSARISYSFLVCKLSTKKYNEFAVDMHACVRLSAAPSATWERYDASIALRFSVERKACNGNGGLHHRINYSNDQMFPRNDQRVSGAYLATGSALHSVVY
ncbi:unnamed protein product [Phytophthora lilii]|uniref:Unnamed protein product n=1 Tax=Phytophthora lilii TaxID=2077276 RepID=A0A9W6X939_9STRA|nr:unnamed protein product [Phytophthora lilii]